MLMKSSKLAFTYFNCSTQSPFVWSDAEQGYQARLALQADNQLRLARKSPENAHRFRIWMGSQGKEQQRLEGASKMLDDVQKAVRRVQKGPAERGQSPFRSCSTHDNGSPLVRAHIVAMCTAPRMANCVWTPPCIDLRRATLFIRQTDEQSKAFAEFLFHHFLSCSSFNLLSNLLISIFCCWSMSSNFRLQTMTTNGNGKRTVARIRALFLFCSFLLESLSISSREILFCILCGSVWQSLVGSDRVLKNSVVLQVRRKGGQLISYLSNAALIETIETLFRRFSLAASSSLLYYSMNFIPQNFILEMFAKRL